MSKRATKTKKPATSTKPKRKAAKSVQPVAQVVRINAPQLARPPRPRVEVMIELIEYLEKEFQVELV